MRDGLFSLRLLPHIWVGARGIPVRVRKLVRFDESCRGNEISPGDLAAESGDSHAGDLPWDEDPHNIAKFEKTEVFYHKKQFQQGIFGDPNRIPEKFNRNPGDFFRR